MLIAGDRITVQWMFWGYSLAYSRDGGPYIGTLKNFGLIDVMVAPSSGSAVLPEVVFCYFQLLFCACTVSSSPYPSNPKGSNAKGTGDHCDWWRIRARQHPPLSSLRLLLGYHRVLSTRPLDVE